MPRADEESGCHAIERRSCPHSPRRRPSVRPGQLPTRATTTDRRRCRCCLQSHVQARRSQARPKNAARLVSGAASGAMTAGASTPAKTYWPALSAIGLSEEEREARSRSIGGSDATSSCPARAKKSCDHDSRGAAKRIAETGALVMHVALNAAFVPSLPQGSTAS